MPIIRRRKAPAHRRVTEEIRRRIAQGEMALGSLVPSRRALAEELDIAVGTVQRAIMDLTADGTLVVQGTRGTFVAPGSDELFRTFRTTSTSTPPVNAEEPVAQAQLSLSTVVISSLDTDENSVQQSTFWLRTVLTSVERAISDAGGTSKFINLRINDVEARTSLTEAVQTAVDGGAQLVVIVTPEEPDECRSLPGSTYLRGVPLVLICLNEVFYPFFSVYYDSRDAGCHAALHLIEGGANNLMFFSPFNCDWVRDRCKGVVEAANQHFFPKQNIMIRISNEISFDFVPKDYVLSDLQQEAVAYRYACELLEAEPAPAGIVAANDFVAYGYMRAASEHGLTAGQDYIIVGFDDNSRSFELGLSTLRPPLEDLGLEAVQLGLRAVRGDRAVLRSCLHSQLVARTSGRFTDDMGE